MKKYVLIAAFLSLAPAISFAQTQAPAASTDEQTPAVATPDTANPTAPVPGKNSFTEDQARQRIMDAGYTDLGSLTLDDQGFWQATAMKDQSKVNVVMDYQGNVVAK